MKQIKICGLSRLEDIKAVNMYKPEYCGFIIDFPKSRRSVSPERVRELTKALSPEIKAVGVFVNSPVSLAAELLNEGTLYAAQLHGDETNDYIEKLRAMSNGQIWQAAEIKCIDDMEKARRSDADLVLLDGGKGEGKAFNWQYLDEFDKPFALAGGLTAENVKDALKTGAVLLDVSGGVETNGIKDAAKIKEFIEKVRNGQVI